MRIIHFAGMTQKITVFRTESAKIVNHPALMIFN